MQHLEICMLMIGNGMLMIPLKVVIGLEIKTLFIICVKKLLRQFCSLNHMECHFLEQNKERFIKEPLVVNQLTEEKVIVNLKFRTGI